MAPLVANRTAYHAFSFIQTKLEESGIPVVLQTNFMSVSKEQVNFNEKIQQLMDQFNFAPFVVDDFQTNQFHFTVCPYKLPHFFRQVMKNKKDFSPSAIKPSKTPHFQLEEFEKAFHFARTVCTESDPPKDPYKEINHYRSFVASSITECLSKLVRTFLQPTADHPAIEIGSGPGYKFDPQISNLIIRTQIEPRQSNLLTRELDQPVFEIDIESLCERVKRLEKRLPKIFEFNTLSATPNRSDCIQSLSSIQKRGDTLMSIIDLMPSVELSFQELLDDYPECEIFPYIDPEKSYQKLSYLIVPHDVLRNLHSIEARIELIANPEKTYQFLNPMSTQSSNGILITKCVQQTVSEDYVRKTLERFDRQNPTSLTFYEPKQAEVIFCDKSLFSTDTSLNRCVRRCTKLFAKYDGSKAKGVIDPFLLLLSLLQKKLQLKVIAAEDFFAERMTQDFEKTGYEARRFYHAAFTSVKKAAYFPSPGCNFLLKTCSDRAGGSFWKRDSEVLKELLLKQGLVIPPEYNDELMQKLESNQEFLAMTVMMVFVATKL